MALHAILKAAGIGTGDQVLLPGYTCVVVPNAINFIGAEPVYLDIEPETFNLDVEKLEDQLGKTWEANRARAIIVQHTYGIPCGMDRIRDFARRHDLIVVEDSCHALGSTWDGVPVGSLGDAAFFSSQWSKPVTTGLGGWARVNNADLAKALEESLPQYPAPGLAEGWQLEFQYQAFNLLVRPRLYFMIQNLYRALGKLGIVIGSSTTEELACALPSNFQKGMHPLQQRRLRQHLRQTDRMHALRTRHTRLIEEALAEHGFPTLKIPALSEPVLLRYPVLVENKQELLLEAQRARVALGDWFASPIHPNMEHWQSAGYTPGSCPVAEAVCRRVVNISTDARMNAREIRRTVKFLARHARPTTPEAIKESTG